MSITLRQFAVVLVVGGPLCSNAFPLDAFFDTNLELTGTVYDAATKQPLEGVYVMAPYVETRSGWAATIGVCVKSRGMVTGKDGKFHFPVEARGGSNPAVVSAVLPDYYIKNQIWPGGSPWDRKYYAGHDIFLARQVPGSPSHRIGSLGPVCHHTEFRQPADGQAYEEHQRRVRIEQDRYLRR